MKNWQLLIRKTPTKIEGDSEIQNAEIAKGKEETVFIMCSENPRHGDLFGHLNSAVEICAAFEGRNTTKHETVKVLMCIPASPATVQKYKQDLEDTARFQREEEKRKADALDATNAKIAKRVREEKQNRRKKR